MKPHKIIAIFVFLLITIHTCHSSGDHVHAHDHGHHGDDAEILSNNDGSHGNRKESQSEMIEKEKKHFIKLLFEKYGHEGRIEFEGFEHLLESLGLAQVKIEDHDIHDHHIGNSGFRNLHKSHLHFKNGTTKPHKKSKKKKKRKWRKELLAAISDAIEPLPVNDTTTKHHHRRHQGRKKGNKQRVKPSDSDRSKRAVVQQPAAQVGCNFYGYVFPCTQPSGVSKGILVESLLFMSV
jgi:hypothetical protein